MKSVEIKENGRVLAKLSVVNGQVVSDRPAGDYVIDKMKHGHRREDGEKLLHAVVQYLDKSTYLSAVLKDEPDEDPADLWSSTEPTEVNNPADHWPDFGERSEADKHDIGATEHDAR